MRPLADWSGAQASSFTLRTRQSTHGRPQNALARAWAVLNAGSRGQDAQVVAVKRLDLVGCNDHAVRECYVSPIMLPNSCRHARCHRSLAERSRSKRASLAECNQGKQCQLTVRAQAYRAGSPACFPTRMHMRWVRGRHVRPRFRAMAVGVQVA